MKKIILYLIVLFCLIFLLPLIFTKKKKEIKNDVITETNTTQTVETKNKKIYNIKLYHTKTNEIEEISLDEYLYGVVAGEIPAEYNIEALKAQAVSARTYTIYQIINSKGKHEDADICDNYACCQAWISKDDRLERWEEEKKEEYWNKITEAVDSTSEQIITYDGKPIDAFFHSNSGGITETAANVWGGNNFPYLKVVETVGESDYSEYSSEVQISKQELVKLVKNKYNEFNINWNEENQIQVTEYTESGRVRTLKIGNINISGTEARSIFGLKSTKFSIESNGNIIKFNVLGYGHGVGMSQTGADSLAKQGYNYKEILKHFYSDVEILTIWDVSF